MALPLCVEASLRAFFVGIKFAVQNWFYTLGIIVLGYIMRRSQWILAGFAWFVDLLQDSILGLGIFTGGLLAIFGKLFLGSVLAMLLGVMWVIMLLVSPANLVLKLFAAPVIFVAGVVTGIFPIPIPVSFVLAFLFKDRRMANITCLAAIVLVVLSSLLNLGFVCNAFNLIIMQLQ